MALKVNSPKKAITSYWVTAVVFCIILRPHFSFLPDTVSVYLFDSLAALILLLSSTNKTINPFALLTLSLLGLAALVKTIFVGTDINIWFDFIKIVYYVTFSHGLRNMFAAKRLDKTYVDRILQLCFIVNIVVCFLQLMDIPVISDAVYTIYGQQKLRTIWRGYPRVYGTFYNANWFGIYLVFMSSFFCERFLLGDKKRFWLNELAVLCMLIVSGSRTAMIGIVLVFIVQLFYHRKVQQGLKIIVAIGLAAAIVVLFANRVPLIANTFNRFLLFFSTLSDEGIELQSISGSRYERWGETLQALDGSMLFGLKSSSIIPHNSFLALLVDFGLIGLLPAVGSLFLCFFYRRHKNRYGYFSSISASFGIALTLIMLSGDYIFSTQVTCLAIVVNAIYVAVPNNSVITT